MSSGAFRACLRAGAGCPAPGAGPRRRWPSPQRSRRGSSQQRNGAEWATSGATGVADDECDRDRRAERPHPQRRGGRQTAACGGSGRLARRPVVLARGRWSVAVVGVPAVGAGGGRGAVGFEAQGPAPAVDHDQVVEGAQRHQVGQGGWATLRSRDQVMNLAATRWLVTAGEGTVRVAGGGGAAQVRRDGGLGFPCIERQRHIQRQARPRCRPGELGLAQPGGQPARAGQHVGGHRQQRPAQPRDRLRR